MGGNTVKINRVSRESFAEIEEQYFRALNLHRAMTEKDLSANHPFAAIVEEEIQHLIGSGIAPDYKSALAYLQDQSKKFATAEHARKIANHDLSIDELERLRKTYNIKRLEKITDQIGLSRISHNYENDQLFSILIDSTIEELLALLPLIGEQSLRLLETGLATGQIEYHGKFAANTSDGQELLYHLNRSLFEDYLEYVSAPKNENLVRRFFDLVLTESNLTLLRQVGRKEDFHALREEAKSQNITLKNDDIVALNEKGRSFLADFTASLTARLYQEYRDFVLTGLGQKKKELVDSISQRLCGGRTRKTMIERRFDHPLVTEAVRARLLQQQKSQKDEENILRQKLFELEHFYDDFSSDFVDIQANLIKNKNNLANEEILLEILFQLETIQKKFGALLGLVEKKKLPSKAHLREFVTKEDEQSVASKVTTEITNDLEKILDKRLQGQPTIRNILINKKNLDRLIEYRLTSDGAIKYAFDTLCNGKNDFADLALYKQLLADVFEAMDESRAVKNHILFEAEEILKEAKIRKIEERLAKNNLDGEERAKLKTNLKRLREAFAANLKERQKELTCSNRAKKLSLVKELTDRDEVKARLREIERKYHKDLYEVQLEIDRQHRKIEEIDQEFADYVDKLLIKTLDAKLR